ncbi:hypothetical protein [Bradyrhizobium icense]|uniref:Uncharacterized protein n=1 Tax=Bradyrhizobium icense TaxID=1274631 RepID=A0A1B1UEZ5_9BRAD|nr:hypothetical protein [Bradyrhizobium icense]ANW01305.1 hypothetical protein LMTR13_15150 [Bradyrhizobium icense]
MSRVLGILLTLLVAAVGRGSAQAETSPDFWDRLALKEDPYVILSVKYADREARKRILDKARGGADLHFINRLVVRIARDSAMSLEKDAGVQDVELLALRSADHTFHRLMELYRVYLYQVSGRFGISAVNFSQGVRYWDRNSGERGDKTIAEALDVLASRIAPVFVAIGDGPELGVGGWALAPSAMPVVATKGNGSDILPNSARPPLEKPPWKTLLYADGEPTEEKNATPQEAACGAGSHLTADQMLRPESAMIPPPGGSSYATFRATWNACFIHQFTEIVRVQLRARTAVGAVEVEPFVAYYVDSPVDKSCSATRNRWADERHQVRAPTYEVRAEDKIRMDRFVIGNVIELRINYSAAMLKAFLNRLPSHQLSAAKINQRFVSSQAVLKMLASFSLADLVEVAANPNSIKFGDWKREAAADTAPVLRPELVSAIEQYCKSSSLLLALPDEAPPFLSELQ